MEEWRDWAGLQKDMLDCISKRIVEPKDFISFRAVCLQWREAIECGAHARFQPWILKGEEVGEDGDVLFYCMSSERYIQIHVPALKGRRTRLAGFGAGHLIAIDQDDELSAVLVYPLLPEESTTLPCLPEWCSGNPTYGFTTDPTITGGDDVFVVIYQWWIDRLRNMVGMWHCGSDAGWATIRLGRFWPAMPQLRSRLAEHGPGVMEGDLAVVATDGNKAWVPSMRYANLIEHEGKVRLLFRQVDEGSSPFLFPWPRVSFTLQDMIGENLALVDWADAPELHDKIILQSWHNICYVLPACDHFTGLSSKNCIYFLSWQCVKEGKEVEYCLCKWDLLERVSTVVKKMPGVWEWVHGRLVPADSQVVAAAELQGVARLVPVLFFCFLH